MAEPQKSQIMDLRQALLMTIWRTRNIVDFPDLACKADYVRVIANELHRSGLVQAVYDDIEGVIRL